MTDAMVEAVEVTQADRDLFRELERFVFQGHSGPGLDGECIEVIARHRLAAIAAMQAHMVPMGFLHTLHMEHGQTSVRITEFEDHAPFGECGKNYDPAYRVTVQPLYAFGEPK